MAIEIKVPSVGESITEVTLVKWLKKDGEWVERDEVVAELESENGFTSKHKIHESKKTYSRKPKHREF